LTRAYPSFLWIPSLQGPVGEYNLKTGLPIDPTGWLFKGKLSKVRT